ncbi:MAG: hypothetical protein EOP06_26995 [Proteobacteria bacterium]|nr:MAG: hypothetical protein EOP06_26995 [Pseudomonadota bacterium]
MVGLIDIEVESLPKGGIHRLEAWTRDDQWVRDWYVKNGFKTFYSYLHVIVEGNQLKLASPMAKFTVVSGFAHYTGSESPTREASRPEARNDSAR